MQATQQTADDLAILIGNIDKSINSGHLDLGDIAHLKKWRKDLQQQLDDMNEQLQ